MLLHLLKAVAYGNFQSTNAFWLLLTWMANLLWFDYGSIWIIRSSSSKFAWIQLGTIRRSVSPTGSSTSTIQLLQCLYIANNISNNITNTVKCITAITRIFELFEPNGKSSRRRHCKQTKLVCFIWSADVDNCLAWFFSSLPRLSSLNPRITSRQLNFHWIE